VSAFDTRTHLTAAAFLTLIPSLALLVLTRDGIGFTEFPLDDGWIHQVYVRSLVIDRGLSYNPGEAQAGFSSLLWLCVCAPLHALARVSGAPIALAAKLTSIASGILASLGIARLAHTLGGDRRAALASQVLLALSWAATFCAVSGMESSLALACSAWALAAHFEGRAPAAGCWLAAASLARPECAVLAGVLAIDAWRTRTRWTLAPTALALTAWGALNHTLTGHPLPTTFYVKARGVSLANNLAVFARDVLLGEGAPHVFVALPLALYALRITPTQRARTVTAMGAAIGVAAVALSRPLFAQVTFFQVRYFVPFSLLGVALAGVGAGHAWERTRPTLRLVATAVALVVLAGGLVHLAWSHDVHCAEVRRLHTEVARDVAQHTPRDAVIAVEAAGAMRFVGGRRVVDLYGLNTATVAFARNNAARTCAIVRDTPSFVAVPPWWEPRLRPAFELRPLRVYTTREAAVIRDVGARSVVLYAARVRPAVAARCRNSH
jgi:hypothetical protein